MDKKPTRNISEDTDVPYNPDDESEVAAFWKDAIHHKGLAEFRAKRGRPKLQPEEKKEQIALRVDRDVLEWFRAQGTGWQSRMNAALRQFKDRN